MATEYAFAVVGGGNVALGRMTADRWERRRWQAFLARTLDIRGCKGIVASSVCCLCHSLHVANESAEE